jgi:uncharacterized membrane-anchored protein
MKLHPSTPKYIIILLGLLLTLITATAQANPKDKVKSDKNRKDKKATKDPDQAAIEEFEAKLKYERGKIVIANGLATLTVPDNFRYLNPEQSEMILTQAWGNPPGQKTLGMIFPSDISPLSEQGWGVVISYVEDGFIKDDDAESIDYNELLSQIREGESEENQQRQQQGYDAMYIVGWAAPPRYDKASHKLYWAKEFRVGTFPVNTLNYDVRVLGRKGYLSLNAVASMKQLSSIENSMKDVLAFTNFNDGNRYSDFNSGTDKVAAYGIGALIAGKVLAKVGFFKLILGGILAAKKFIIFALLALGAFIKRIFRAIFGNKKEENPDAPTSLNI